VQVCAGIIPEAVQSYPVMTPLQSELQPILSVLLASSHCSLPTM
jgi:hypothetical protein